MTNMRRYYVRDILGLAAELRQKFDDGALSSLEFTLALNDFRFRDEKGDYWLLDARTTRWYRFDQRAWKPSDTDPAILEGPAALILDMPVTIDNTKPGFEGPTGEEPQEWTPVRGIETMAKTARVSYQQGRMSSASVEELCARQYLTDQQGRFWTVGLRSAQWYCFEDRQWRKAEQPPSPDALLRAEPGAQASDTLLQAYSAMLQFFFSGADGLPERVTEPWNPPPGFPEPLTAPDMRCHSCGARNPAGSLFCNRCGTGLGCPSCGAVNPPDHRFCTQCGAALGG